MAVVTMRQLLESGVHFGHQTRRWNPKMKRFIMTERNGIYIIDLQKSLGYIDTAFEFVKETVSHGGSILFVGTKKQAQESIAEQAKRVGQPYVNQRWLGGLLTNFQTVSKRLARMKAELTPVPGIPEALAALSGYPKAVASNGPLAKIRLAMATSGLAPHFGDNLYSAYELQVWKPDPGLYLAAAEGMGAEPENCVVIDDAAVGVEAGLKAGMQVIHINHFPDEEHTPEGAIAITHASELVTVIERAAYIGGLLALGIPEFKLEKGVVQRRIDLMAEEGITFLANTNVGADYPVDRLLSEFDAVCLACGSTQARELDVPGRELDGVHLAMDYLSQQNRVLSGEDVSDEERINAEGKRVVILGGGDTGADCLGTAHRQGAEVVYQIELLDEPPQQRPGNNPWPEWPQVLRSSPAHEEGGIRDYAVLTKSFTGSVGKLEKLQAVRVEWKEGSNGGRPSMEEIPGSEFEIKTELILLAMGFLHPEHDGMLAQIGVELDGRGNVAIDGNHMSSVPGVFAAGDAARGQSLVVWAIAEGRETARAMDLYLMGETSLPHSLPEDG